MRAAALPTWKTRELLIRILIGAAAKVSCLTLAYPINEFKIRQFICERGV